MPRAAHRGTRCRRLSVLEIFRRAAPLVAVRRDLANLRVAARRESAVHGLSHRMIGSF